MFVSPILQAQPTPHLFCSMKEGEDLAEGSCSRNWTLQDSLQREIGDWEMISPGAGPVVSHYQMQMQVHCLAQRLQEPQPC